MELKDKIKNKKNTLYITVAVIIVAGCLWAFISASLITHNFKEKIVNQTYKNKEANIESLLVTETKDNEKLWELYADNGMYTDTDNIVLLEGIIGNLYEDNAVKASFKADRGTYNNSTKNIILYDNILMVYKDGTSIRANKINYKGRNEDIIAEGAVTIEKPGEAVVIGNRAVLNGNYSDFHIEGRTQTHFYM